MAAAGAHRFLIREAVVLLTALSAKLHCRLAGAGSVRVRVRSKPARSTDSLARETYQSASVRAARACKLFPYMREIFAGPGRPGPRQFLNRAEREGSSARGVFASTRPIYHDSRQRWNNVAFVGVVGGKGDEHELRAVGQLNVSGVMARF